MDDLPTGAAGSGGFASRGIDDDTLQRGLLFTGGDGVENGRALCADAESIGCIFDIAARIYSSGFGENGGADLKLRIGSVGSARRRAGLVFELLNLSGGQGHQSPSSSFTSANFSIANVRSSLLCAAETCVRIRAVPWGTTG